MFFSKSEPETIALRSEEVNKFYEPLVLLKVLNNATKDKAVQASLEASIDATNQGEAFKAFVYKLAHICDSEKGGSTVTAFAVLREKGGCVHYQFASNQRSHEKLEETKAYIQGLLNQVKDFDVNMELEKSPSTPMLKKVLIFNRRRVTYYLKRMRACAKDCMEFQRDGDTRLRSEYDLLHEAYKIINDALQELIQHAQFDTPSNTSDKQFAEMCLLLIDHLDNLKHLRVGSMMFDRASKGRSVLAVPSFECWSDLQHFIGRILAYKEFIKFIMFASFMWPDLFKRFRISYYESSKKMKKPCPEKSQTAEAIVHRMTDDQQMKQVFRVFVRDLQMFQLDNSIQEECEKKSFRPIVHSEVLLLNELEKQGLLKPQHFFNRCMYIGSSKPTCRLCDHYFEAHDSKVGRRVSHGNLYLNWRFPDVLRTQGKKGEKKRQAMFERVLRKVRHDAFEVVMRKTPSRYKKEDSITVSATMSAVVRRHMAITRPVEGYRDDLASVIALIGSG
ncbi:hypothetical protein B0T10DRAFT_567149 [Thelonectria olida]|uniref:Uncharacterized protein n=1 Tax=Thelonectria olida TaxID=1576542 RepID=A0A9P9AIQ6_9HYPO|nr:hypothetical protein B0T10DRAFT_567149 [Thelonectria olida]